jgi:hypothetical protein
MDARAGDDMEELATTNALEIQSIGPIEEHLVRLDALGRHAL